MQQIISVYKRSTADALYRISEVTMSDSSCFEEARSFISAYTSWLSDSDGEWPNEYLMKMFTMVGKILLPIIQYL